MQVEYLVTMSLPDDGWAVKALEEACFRAARNAAKKLFLQALKQEGEKVLAKLQGEKKGEAREAASL